jgi:signal-transduction protein with cAMP-binding, CBS, and nucleotidyltransferase domain
LRRLRGGKRLIEDLLKIEIGDLIMSRVGSFMSSPVSAISPDTLAHDAMVILLENKVGTLLVKENEDYVGIFTKADWMRKVLKGDGYINSEEVGSVMSKSFITIERSETLGKASLLMEEHSVRHIAVTDKGEIVGVLSTKDLERYYHQLHDQE